MNCGLIGCGRIAHKHLAAMKENDICLVAVCDLYEDKMNNIISEYNEMNTNVRKYTDYRELIQKEKNINFVAIATDSGTHFKIASYCMKYGVGVILEKPITLSIEEADYLVHLEKNNNKVMVCFQNRYNYAIQVTKRALNEGRLGKISHIALNVRWHRDEHYYKQDAWRGTWRSDGGVLMNQSIHGIDILLWLIGSEPVSVCGTVAQRFHDYIEAEDLGCAIIKFKNGVIGTIEGTTNTYKENFEETLCVFGEYGTVKIGGKSLNKVEKWEFRNETETDGNIEQIDEKVPNIYGNGHSIVYKKMKGIIEKENTENISLLEGKKALEVILAIYKSSKEQKWISLPLQHFGTRNMY